MTFNKVFYYIKNMRKLYRFFVLIFTIEKNKNLFVQTTHEQFSCNYISSNKVTFSVSKLFEILSKKQGKVFLDCLTAFAATDISKYKISNIKPHISQYYKINGVNTSEDFYLFKDYINYLSQEEVESLLLRSKLSDSITAIYQKRYKSPARRKNSVQEFFFYIYNNYQPGEGEKITAACLHDIKIFFAHNGKICSVEQLNQNSDYLFNYFGSFFYNVINNKRIAAQDLMEVLRLIFCNDSTIIDFLFSLNLINENSTIFKNFLNEGDIKKFLLQKFSKISSYEELGNTIINKNFNFEKCKPDNAAILYLFDSPEFLQQALKHKIKNFTGAYSVIALLKSITKKIKPEHNERWIEHETYVMDTLIEQAPPKAPINKI